jgi:hypothetical protein
MTQGLPSASSGSSTVVPWFQPTPLFRTMTNGLQGVLSLTAPPLSMFSWATHGALMPLKFLSTPLRSFEHAH